MKSLNDMTLEELREAATEFRANVIGSDPKKDPSKADYIRAIRAVGVTVKMKPVKDAKRDLASLEVQTQGFHRVFEAGKSTLVPRHFSDSLKRYPSLEVGG